MLSPKQAIAIAKQETNVCYPTPNVTDFLTFLCYRRTHTLPANLNFNKLFVVTGERQQQQKQQNEQKSVEKAKPDLVRSLVKIDNNNKGDNFSMRVVLRRLFLNESFFKQEDDIKIVKKRGSKRSPETIEDGTRIKLKKVNNRKKSDTKTAKKSPKALKNVQNTKKQPSKRDNKRLSKKTQPVIISRSKSVSPKHIPSPLSTERKKRAEKSIPITSRKTDKSQTKSKTKPSSLKSSSSQEKQQRRQQNSKGTKSTKIKNKKTQRSNKIKFIRN